ncbi:SDR family oxidoreductase [Solihabitans fulvus]|uniref:SDR family oxidoreductase n=1 Tax=Solihabitans fulvus TaxID=1892852 RepID=A0A5B2XVJ7_9PSEU|nr:SDR family oxidoreductase [Solihabitans fulvus]KAA2267010.1 SDR family oxidoreductase [Solihabitans fulvus]
MTAGTTVVIGAAQGIGAEMARNLAAAPWTRRLVLADARGEAVKQVAETLCAEGFDVFAEQLDITDADAVSAFVAGTADAERVALVAGAFAAAAALDVQRAEFLRLLEVNLLGVYFVAQEYARHMVARGSGSIIAVASIAARLPRMRQAAYCASKAGMRQALRVLGMEVAARGVRVNTISPGVTDTPMMRALAKDHPSVDHLAAGSAESLRSPILDGRVGTPADVANVATFLLSPESNHIVLQDVVVDGGELLGI